MGQDDDADCVEHVWALTELGLVRRRLHRGHECVRCGAIRYDDGQAAERRPPL